MAAEPTNSRHRITLDEDAGIAMVFRLIPAGSFRIGSRGMGRVISWFNHEEPIHTVAITRDFWMAETPVTQAQFAVWKPDHENHFADRPDHPAEQMNWHEATEFCHWLSATETIRKQFPEDVESAGLPSEAQWEYACRAGSDTEYNSGDGEAALAMAGWYEENSGWETHPVCSLAPNAWELYDLHGNVWEWCRDVWNPDAYRLREDGVEDPETTKETPGSESEDRVLRGGSWYSTARSCRSAFRSRNGAGYRSRLRGFRVCLFPGPVAAARSTGEAGGRKKKTGASDPDGKEAGGTPKPESGR